MENQPAPSPARAIFIVGCQRSGTTMLAELLALTAAARVYHEGDATAFHKFRLREPDAIRAVLAASDQPCVVFKSICDSQITGDLLAAYPGSRAVWIYRNYRDVAASAVTKWQGHQAKVMQRMFDGDWSKLNWAAERLEEADLDPLRAARPTELSPGTGAAIFWYLRNQFFFKQDLERREEVVLLRYETLVQQSQAELQRLSGRLGFSLTADDGNFVRRDSVAKGQSIEIDPAIAALCEELQGKLAAICEGKTPA